MARVIREDLSVRDTEKRVRDQSKGAKEKTEPTTLIPESRKAATEPWVREVETRLRQSLGTKVRLQNGPNVRGQIVIEYYEQAGLESLLERLAPKKTL